MIKTRTGLLAGLTSTLLLFGGACSGGSDSDGAATDEGGSETGESTGNVVKVSLFEWGIDAPATAAAGEVTFEVTNDGGETHELVIVRADSPDGFTTDETGKVDEDGFAEGDLIGEIEEFEAGTTESATFDLEAGTYTIFCNIVEEEDDGGRESHFQEGMVATIVLE